MNKKEPSLSCGGSFLYTLTSAMMRLCIFGHGSRNFRFFIFNYLQLFADNDTAFCIGDVNFLHIISSFHTENSTPSISWHLSIYINNIYESPAYAGDVVMYLISALGPGILILSSITSMWSISETTSRSGNTPLSSKISPYLLKMNMQ